MALTIVLIGTVVKRIGLEAGKNYLRKTEAEILLIVNMIVIVTVIVIVMITLMTETDMMTEEGVEIAEDMTSTVMMIVIMIGIVGEEGEEVMTSIVMIVIMSMNERGRGKEEAEKGAAVADMMMKKVVRVTEAKCQMTKKI